ncbi:hypothetical protein [Streptomyces sp. NPDC060194]|uniref:hypothetical protein n=1 Tax=Streptomyces sp. NPDC060194 TaxID=3347069 RepID=UPI0036494B84
MQNLKRTGRETGSEYVDTADTEAADSEFDAYDTFETYRVICPDCAQSIALLADETVLPEHGLCASPWDPFGLTVCDGTGRRAAEAVAVIDAPIVVEPDAVILTLPQGLDWRHQPFSHVGGPGSRPVKVSRPLHVSQLRRAA